MKDCFVMCARGVKGGRFEPEPGKTLFLLVPPGQLPSPKHEVQNPDVWVNRVLRQAVWGKDERTGGDRGDVLVFVHGYNNSQKVVMERHLRLAEDLAAAGFKGVVLSFDWPSADKAMNYLEDRHDAKATAMQLVEDGIKLLAKRQGPGCTVNVHLLGHSTGAYVLREAFDDADDATLAQSGWVISQIAFIGGDLSSASMSEGNPSTEALYRHCVRLTNYSNHHDSVLKISNTKRLGMAPRVGRAGLPEDAPAKAVDVDCSEYFGILEKNSQVLMEDQKATIGSFPHSWHIGNKVFTLDLFETLRGDRDRAAFPTRSVDSQGKISLKRP